MKLQTKHLIVLLTSVALIFSLIFIASCNKNNSAPDNGTPGAAKSASSVEAGESNAGDTSIANQLISTYSAYNMHYMTSAEKSKMTSMRKFTSYSTAKSYVDSLLRVINTAANTSDNTDSYNGAPAIQAPDCTKGGSYHVVFHNTGGLFSHFEAYVTTTSTGISSMNFYSVGTPIGWTWTQFAPNINNSSFSGCTPGTITIGLQIGNLPLAITENYHFSYVIDPTTCTMVTTASTGPCL